MSPFSPAFTRCELIPTAEPIAMDVFAGRRTLEEHDERVSSTFSNSSASTDLPPLNSEMQADAARIAAIIAGSESTARSSFAGGLSNASDTPFTFVCTPAPVYSNSSSFTVFIREGIVSLKHSVLDLLLTTASVCNPAKYDHLYLGL